MIRRVVTGQKNGKSVLVSDGTPSRTHAFEHSKGLAFSLAWATPTHPRLSAANQAEAVTDDTTVIPPLGETRFMFLQLPPESSAVPENFDPAAAGSEIATVLADLGTTMEPNTPGMHRTDSVDYIIVLDGEVHLELDDAQEVLLKTSDVVVQGGGRHAWRNKSDRTALLAFILVGAERDVD